MIGLPGSIWGQLRDKTDNGVWDLVGSGAPTNGTSGTGVGLAGPGSTYTDYTNKIRYVNTNTLASPTWNANITASSTQTLTNKTLTSPTINTPTIALNAASVAAAGTNQTTAATTSTAFPLCLLVTGADGTKGFKLGAATAGAVVYVKNADAANAQLPVYPATGETINALSANAAFTMSSKTACVLMCVVAGAWVSIPLVAS